MATEMEKDVLIEFIASTIIGVSRNNGSEEDRDFLRSLRHENYATPCEEVDYQKTLAILRRMRDKYDLDDSSRKGRNELSVENKVKLKELKIFRDIKFEFGNGWTDLIFELGKNITELCELTNCELPMIQQIKTKFGTLRFYYNTLNSEYPEAVKKSMRALVSITESSSGSICEVCGGKAEIRAKMINKYTLWITTCDEHKEDSLTMEEWKEYQKRNTKDEIISKLKELKPLYKEKGLEIICIDDNKDEDYRSLDIFYKIDMEIIKQYTKSVKEGKWVVAQLMDFFDEIKSHFKIEITFKSYDSLKPNYKVIYIEE